ncbi:MAG: SDR family NAD(P)-dependent oxidoreductase, partial [Actinobacteria bacterium]|nr:SDR family NAD(P)-dependent oxidoreductase [Actinomycetota bacterium]
MTSLGFRLDGLRALVTGGGSGIGKAIASAMRDAGATVVVCDVNDSTSPNFVCDVSKTADVEAMFKGIERDLGGLDILVNNVGVPGPTARVDEMDPDAYDECVRVNL